MAVFALAMLYVGRDPAYLSPQTAGTSAGLMATVALNHATMEPYYVASSAGDRNIWPMASFEWTNTGQSVSTSASGSKINRLLH